MSGPFWLSASSVIAGLSSFLVTLLVSREVGPGEYSSFAVFWSSVYLVAGVLVGFQQEITRLVVMDESSALARGRHTVTSLAVVVSAVVIGLVVGISIPFWGPAALGGALPTVAGPIVTGAVLYVFLGALSGVLSGQRRWHRFAMLIATDGLARLLVIVCVLVFGGALGWLAWGTVVPFAVATLVIGFASTRVVRRSRVLPVRAGPFAWNSVRTLLASSGSAILVTGFPLVLSFFAGGVEKATLGAVVLAISITRAPLLMPLTAFQSFFVVSFQRGGRGALVLLCKVLAVIAGVAVGGGGAAWLIGPELFSLVFGPGYRLPGIDYALLTASAGLIAMMYVAGAAVLARAGHGAYALGWLIAVLVTIAVLFIPLPFDVRVGVALLAGGAGGLFMQLMWLLSRPEASAIASREADALS